AWPRYRVLRLQELGQYNLEILSAELSDDSLYECQVPDAALRSRRAKLTVLSTCASQIARQRRDGLPVEGANSMTEVLPDRKRVTTRSYLPIQPVDTDTGRNYSCMATNLAVPAGKSTTVTLNVHRGLKGGVVLQGARESVFTTKADHSFFTEPVSCLVFNAVGKTNVSILVDVHFGPILLVEPQPKTVDVDSDVNLNCKWAGNPPLTLTWFKKGSNMVLSNSNQLYLKSVSQADAGQYVCKAIVPRIGVGETEVTLTVNGPPIISSDPVQYAVRGERGEVKCYIASTPPPDKIVWAWKENVWEKEKGTLLERYTVEQSKPSAEGGGVLSTLTINNVIESDFLSTYNCTAWNAFGPGTMIITLEETGRRGVTLGKPDIKVETINKETHSLEEDSGSVSSASRMVKAMYSDPTNGYYNVRASTHDEGRPASGSTMHYSDYRSPAGTPGGAASISSSTGGSGATASGGAPVPPGPLTSPGRPQACYDPRPPSRLSHISYAQFNTFTRGGQSQQQPAANPAPVAGDFPGDCSLMDSTSQLAYDNYGYPSHYQTYPHGLRPV
ncbi:unnamed protein product, partial [Tetraodon nigroviridis]